MFQVAELVELHVDPVIRFWTGRGDLVVNGVTYLGTDELLYVGEFEQRASNPSERMRIHISVVDDARLAYFMQDRGPFKVVVKYLARVSDAQGWSLVPVQFVGKASSPAITERVLKLELETLKGDVDGGVARFWSHEDQTARFPGDKGFDDMRRLAEEGVDTIWPS